MLQETFIAAFIRSPVLQTARSYVLRMYVGNFSQGRLNNDEDQRSKLYGPFYYGGVQILRFLIIIALYLGNGCDY